MCSCSGQPYAYYAEGTDGTTACDAVFDYCDDPVTPTFDGAGECQTQYQSGSAGYCQTQISCLLTSEIGDGVYVASSDLVNTSCANDVNGGATCTCQNSAGAFNFAQEAPVTGIASCDEASVLCQKIATVEPDGEPVCTNTSQSAQGDFCNATLDCTASASVDETAISLHGYINLSCSRDASSWACSCSSGSQYETISVQAENAWEACTNGSRACEEAVEVEFGNGSGGGGFGGSPGFPTPGPGTGGVFF
jgi:hypothetical protein